MLLGNAENDSPPSVDLTPVIDMVFLLLIFFLVATTFQQTEREMQITLPQTESGGPITMSLRELVINVDEEGSIIVSGRQLSEQELETLVQEALAANPEQKVVVRGDAQGRFGVVARVLDICKVAGIQEPYLDTVPIR